MSGDKDTLPQAESSVQTLAGTVFGLHEEWASKTCNSLLEYTITTASGDKLLIAVVTVLVAKLMSFDAGSLPKKDVMKDMRRRGVRELVLTWIKNPTSAVEMLEMLDS